MKEKNIILAARTISIVFTPFYLPVLGLVALFLLSYLNRLVPWYYKLTARAGNEGATNGALHHLDCVLLRMLLHHEPVSHPTFHQQYPHHGTRHPNYLCAHQRLVEDIYPLGSHRWGDRRIDVVCLVVSLQSYLVALFGYLIRGIGGIEPHHSQATHTATGECWIHCWSDICLLYYLNDLKSNS